jgi:DNA-binding transcriptional regulator YiaG
VPKFRVAFTSYYSYGTGLLPLYPVRVTNRRALAGRPSIENYAIRCALPPQFRGQRLYTLKNTGDCYLILDTARFDLDTVIAWLMDGYHDNIRILDGDVSDHEGPEFQYRPVRVTFRADESMTTDEFDAVAAAVMKRMSTIPGGWVECPIADCRTFLGIYKIRAESAFLFSDDWDRALMKASRTLSEYSNWLVFVEPVPEDDRPMPFEPLDEAEARLGFRGARWAIHSSEPDPSPSDEISTRQFPPRWPRPRPQQIPRSAMSGDDSMVESTDRRSKRAPAMAGPALTAAGLSAARRVLRITRPELARLLDVHERTVRRFESGEQPIPRSVEIIIKLMLSGVTTAAEISRL